MKPIIESRNLVKKFPIKGGIIPRPVGHVHAVNGVSLKVYPGETLGIVGESGCGKSTFGRSLLFLDPPSEGEVYFEGRSLGDLKKSKWPEVRQDLAMIFQDPSDSLNPRMTVAEILLEPFQIHNIGDRKSRLEKISVLLDQVGLPQNALSRYPHEFSGGQKQRIGIARALALNPKVILCDEAVSALDVSVQAQILNLLIKLQKDLGLTYVFISHDLSVVKYISDRVAVMYFGKIVELATSEEIYQNPRHPYTKALLSSIPDISPDSEFIWKTLPGGPPSASEKLKGCAFAERCFKASTKCTSERPILTEGEHQYSCHHPLD